MCELGNWYSTKFVVQSDMARTGIRASAIIIKNGKILLIHRKKNNEEYWVFPDGGIEDGETGIEAVIREIKEETGLDCTKAVLAFEVETLEGGNKHPFYLCEVEDGEVKLGGPELARNSEDNWYDPQWIEIDKVDELNLVPEGAKAKLFF